MKNIVIVLNSDCEICFKPVGSEPDVLEIKTDSLEHLVVNN